MTASSSAATDPRGLVGRISAAWAGGIRPSTARELAAEHGEGRILAYALGSCLGLLLARLPIDIQQAARMAEPPNPGALVTANVVSMLFFTPIFLYAVAGLLGVALRAAGGTGSYRDTRLALFWAEIVAIPAVLLAATVEILLRSVGTSSALAQVPGAAAGLLAAWFWCAALAEAHGFRRAWPAFALLASAAVALALLGAAGP